MAFLLVAVGGIAGAVLRFQISRWMNERIVSAFPFATVLINVTGAFILGLLTSNAGLWFPAMATQLGLLVGTGFCGAYTTFSTFSYEFVMLVRERRLTLAIAYFLTTTVLGGAAAAAGLFAIHF